MINFGYFFQSLNHGILGQYFRNMKEIFMTKKGALTGLLLFGIFFGAGNLIFPPSLGALSGEQFLRKSHLGLRRFILQSSIYRLALSLPFHVQRQQLTKSGLAPFYQMRIKDLD